MRLDSPRQQPQQLVPGLGAGPENPVALPVLDTSQNRTGDRGPAAGTDFRTNRTFVSGKPYRGSISGYVIACK